ncbi:MAG: split soret cytochrome c precursor [Firmicutes bacterium HGW-Firmicutes-14]|nr:MAG: split soret cytochrome c precursor [Firmicutes bacterium HGW-Firmicutes-14]
MAKAKNRPIVEDNSGLTRRKFLVSAGALATGLAVTGGIAGCASTGGGGGNTSATASSGAAPLPWKYQKLDVELVRKRGYEGYYKFGCCYGAASALLTTLTETSGGSWGTIPQEMFAYGAGGAYSWGTLCGALNGSLAVINLASEKHADIGNELMGWYTEFPFPSEKHDSYCKIPKQMTTVSKSPLCHVSVSTWANKAGARINEEAKKERCAKLTGDTAAHVAEMLNMALEGKFAAAYAVPGEFDHCMKCHQGEKSQLDNQQGKMNCISCHDDHTKNK